jgi:site-specific DNA-methyltransferase (adenine-specific)
MMGSPLDCTSLFRTFDQSWRDIMPRPFYRRAGIAIYHGDCRKILPLLKPESVDLVLTDPPYGIGFQRQDLAAARRRDLGKKRRTSRAFANDDDRADPLFYHLLAESVRLLKPGSYCCCCCSGGGGRSVNLAWWILAMSKVFEWEQAVVWDKGPMGLGWRYRRSYELVLVGRKPGGKAAWYDTTHRVENVIRDIRKIVPRQHQHPTAKPVKLMEKFILLHTKPGDLIVDPFMGHGPTLVAAERLGRRAIGIEYSRANCRAAVEMLQADRDARR